MTIATAQDQACCNCDCRRVIVRAVAVDHSSGFAIENAPDLPVSMNIKDADCRGRAATGILTRFERSYSIHESKHPDGIAEVWVTAPILGPSIYRFASWVVINRSTGFEQTFYTQTITVAVNWPGELEVVAVYAANFTPDGGNPWVACDPDYAFPAHVRLTKPASINLSVIDSDACDQYEESVGPDLDAFEYPATRCRQVRNDLTGGWIPRTVNRTFARMGAADIDMRCNGASSGQNRAPLQSSFVPPFGVFDVMRWKDEYSQFGAHSPIFTYETRNAIGVCARLHVQTAWGFGWTYRPGGQSARPGQFVGVARCILEVDLYGDASPDTSENPWRGRILLESLIRITDYIAPEDLIEWFAARAEHTSPACPSNGHQCVDGGYHFQGWSPATPFLPYGMPPHAPNYIYASDGQQINVAHGGSADWLDFANFTLGVVYKPEADAVAVAPCGCKDRSFDTGWLYPWGSNSYDPPPFTALSLWNPASLSTNREFGFSVESIAPDDYEVDVDDCPCIDENPDWPIGIGYKLSGVTLTEQSCNLDCTADTYTADAFPDCAELTCPDQIDVDGLFQEQSGVGGYPCQGLIPLAFNSFSTPAKLNRHRDLPATVVCEGECITSMISPGGSPYDDLYAALMFHFNNETPLTLEGFVARYNPDVSNYANGVNQFWLYTGYFTNTGNGIDPEPTARIFSAARLLLNTKNISNFTGNNLTLWAFNIGPEFVVSDYTEDERRSIGAVDNAFSYSHVWDFSKFYLQKVIPTNFGSGDDCTEQPTDADVLSYYNCAAISFAPNVYDASSAKKTNGPDFATGCASCDGFPDYYEYLCNSGRLNRSFAFAVRGLPPTTPTAVAASASVRPWLRYCVLGSDCD